MRHPRPQDRTVVVEPAARLFSEIRTRLTLLYCVMVGGALLVCGLVLYFGVREMLFRPINDDLAARAARLSAQWQQSPEACVRPSLGFPFRLPSPNDQHLPGPGFKSADFLVPNFHACYSPTGTFLGPGDMQNILPSTVLANSLIVQAAQSGPVSDTVDGGGVVGAIQRFALPVQDPSDPSGHTLLGVVLEGESASGQVAALDALRDLLILLGAATMIATGFGGLFLSKRALAPAHMAFQRQQTFIADASHELRTPLTLLRADADVLLRTRSRLAPDDAELIEDIAAEASHMSVLAGNMLALARLDAGNQHLERDVVDLTALATALARRSTAYAAAQGLTLTAQPAGPALVIGDRGLLEQAALVLVDNAIKYNRPGGTVTVWAGIHQGQALLQVRDNGIGIAPEHLPHLGERFYRVDKARSRETGGAGLGISIARGIAALHAGTLTLASAPGHETVATLALPAARGAIERRSRPEGG